jgi:hypothetical protein
METVKKYWMQITGTIAIVTPLVTWGGRKILEGEYQKGYNEAKNEIAPTADKAVHDAILYRVKYETCCSKAD